ncbi:MAG: hypothetical protein J7L45_00680 [Candidatus Aenigmarchaeota archaeon]|nr:hypothetical protein [Candidatus Aenigmarchaeota archaeon]
MSNLLEIYGIKEKDIEEMKKFVLNELEPGKEYSQYELVATAVKGLNEERYQKVGFKILENSDIIAPMLGIDEFEKNGCKFYKFIPQ